MSAISLTGVHKRFQRTEVLQDITLDVADGEFVVFVGPSGCGKSTLLRLIAGLEDTSEGRIVFDGEDVTEVEPAGRGVAMVFQSYALYPHMSAYDNLAFGLKLAKTRRGEIRQRVEDAARVLQIDHLLARKPRELSGGQRQRVAIGRAIVRQPRVFLFDEPLSNLDAALRVQMRLELQRLHRDLGTTMIYVTHDQVEAMTLADRIVVLNQGVIEQVGTPLALYRRPCNRFVAGFIGSPTMNFLDGSVVETRADRVRVDLGPAVTPLTVNGDVPVGSDVSIGVRPEHLTLSPGADDVRVRGRVVSVEHLGVDTCIYVDCGAPSPVVVRADAEVRVGIDDALEFGFPAQAALLFDADGRARGAAGDGV